MSELDQMFERELAEQHGGSPISTSFTAVSPRWMRGRLCGLLGDPGGHCRRPNRSDIDRMCTAGDAVAPGWSQSSLVDATVRY